MKLLPSQFLGRGPQQLRWSHLKVAATGQPHYQQNWKPLAPGFINVEYNNIEAIKKATNQATCAVLIEPLQGEGGVNIPDQNYLPSVREWCDQEGLLLIFDEVQTGLGRLGTLWGYERFGVEPDVMTLAKALGGGVPIGAFLAKNHAACLEPGDHGSTFGGNALTCAAAYASTEYIVSREVPKYAAEMGDHLRNGLDTLKSALPAIVDVRGMGLLLAVEFDSDIAAKVVSACNEEGLLLNPVRPNAVRLMPPLTITAAEIDEALLRLERGIDKVLGR